MRPTKAIVPGFNMKDSGIELEFPTPSALRRKLLSIDTVCTRRKGFRDCQNMARVYKVASHWQVSHPSKSPRLCRWLSHLFNKPFWQKLNRFDNTFRRVLQPRPAVQCQISQDQHTVPRRLPLRRGQARNRVEHVLCSKAAIRAIAAAVHAQGLSTQQQIINEGLNARCDLLVEELGLRIKSVDAKQQADQIAGRYNVHSLAQLEEAVVS